MCVQFIDNTINTARQTVNAKSNIADKSECSKFGFIGKAVVISVLGAAYFAYLKNDNLNVSLNIQSYASLPSALVGVVLINTAVTYALCSESSPFKLGVYSSQYSLSPRVAVLCSVALLIDAAQRFGYIS